MRGQRYGIGTDARRVTGTSGSDDIVGSIVGAITGGTVRGEEVRLPAGTTIMFRIEERINRLSVTR